MKNLNAILSVLVLSIVSTACGNIQSGQLNSANYNVGSNSSGNGLTGAAACASNPNVVGQGYNNSLQNQYRVCNTGTVGTINIYPEDSSTKNVCVFPVKVVGAQVLVLGMVKCSTVRDSGISMAFGNVGFNAAYIVDYNAANQFSSCLSQAAGGYSLSACTSQLGIGAYYAYGQF